MGYKDLKVISQHGVKQKKQAVSLRITTITFSSRNNVFNYFKDKLDLKNTQ